MLPGEEMIWIISWIIFLSLIFIASYKIAGIIVDANRKLGMLLSIVLIFVIPFWLFYPNFYGTPINGGELVIRVSDAVCSDNEGKIQYSAKIRNLGSKYEISKGDLFVFIDGNLTSNITLNPEVILPGKFSNLIYDGRLYKRDST